MNIPATGGMTTSETSGMPQSVSLIMLRKTLDMASQEHQQLLDMVAQSTGVGTRLDTTA